MPSKSTLGTILVALLVVIAGCAGFGGAGAGDGSDASSSRDGGTGDGDAPPPSEDGSNQQAQGDVSSQPLQIDRAIIRTGTVRLQVEEFAAARTALSQRVRSMGGYVGGSGETQHSTDNTTWSSGYLVLRVPADQYSEMLSFARERGEVLSAETSTKDVTDRLVDIEARMTNLKERRSRLRAFYERANSTQELLRIEESLSNVQAQIEKLAAEKRSLEQRVSYATLRVELREQHATTRTEATQETEQSVGAAFFGSVATIVDIGQWSVLFIAGLTPYLVVIGVPAAVLYGLFRRKTFSLVSENENEQSQSGHLDEDSDTESDHNETGGDDTNK